MATITLRSIKGSPLTIAEVDQNFSNLNVEVGQKLDSASYTAADVLNKLKTVDTDTSGLNATTLKSMDPLSTSTNNSIVMRDSSGSFAANNITANNFIGNVTGNTSGTASNITGTLAVINGGTGANSPSAALDNLLPAGEVPGYVLKTSGPGTYFWALETGATTLVGTRINTSRVSYTATAGQTVFTGIGQYTIGSGQLRVYINGVRQFPDAYTETSTTTFTLTNGVAAGTKVLAEVDSSVSYQITANSVSFTPTGTISSTNVQDAISELLSELGPSIVPAGIIAMWSGSSTNIPSGWALCNGANGTPDLRDRFVVGAGSTYAVGATGGSTDAVVVSHTHTATVTDPGHQHTYTGGASWDGSSAGPPYGFPMMESPAAFTLTNYVFAQTNTTGITVGNSTTGVSGANANLPPYYALCYIMKL